MHVCIFFRFLFTASTIMMAFTTYGKTVPETENTLLDYTSFLHIYVSD